MNFKIKVFSDSETMNIQAKKQRLNIIKDEERVINQTLQRFFTKGIGSTGYELVNFQLETTSLKETGQFTEFKLYDKELNKYYYINIKNHYSSNFTETIEALIKAIKGNIVSSSYKLGKTSLNDENEAFKAINNINTIIEKRLTKTGKIGKLQGNEEEKILINFLNCLYYYDVIQNKLQSLTTC